MIRLQIIPEAKVNYSAIHKMILNSMAGQPYSANFKSDDSGIKGELISSEIIFPDSYESRIMKSMDRFNGFEGFQIRICLS